MGGYSASNAVTPSGRASFTANDFAPSGSAAGFFGSVRCVSVNPSSAAAINSIEFPSDLCMSRPVWSLTVAKPNKLRNGGSLAILVESASSE